MSERRRITGQTAAIPWAAFRNDSGETIPAFAPIRVVQSVEVQTDLWVIKGQKPNRYGARHDVYLNDHRDVANGDTGLCAPATIPMVARYSGGTPVAGELWGPINDSWDLKEYVGGFRVLAVLDSPLVLVRAEPLLQVRGELAEDLEAGATAEIDITQWISSAWSTAGSYTMDIREATGLADDVLTGTVVWAEYDPQTDEYVASRAEC